MDTDDSLIRTVVIVIAAIVLLPLLVMVFIMPIMSFWGWGHMWGVSMWDGTGATWMWLIMSLVPLLVLLGIGYLLYSAIRQSDTKRRDAAVEELRTAYARGEITDEEFEERRERRQSRV